MKLKIIDGVKKRITTTPSKKLNSKTTSTNYINICFLNYLNDEIKTTASGGGYFE